MIPDHAIADLNTQVVQREGRVHLLFSREVEGEMRAAQTDHVMWPAETALQLGQLVIDMAFEADTGLKPVGPAAKSALVDRHRDILTNRLVIMLGTFREKKTKTNRQLAKLIVDEMLREVFS